MKGFITKRGQTGFTMLEVLVAIVVLSFGLLGLAGLQADGLRNNTSAYLRSQATLMAYDMLDRMRANMQGVANGDYNNLLNTTPADPACISSGCSIEQMTQHDAYEWSQKLAELLPSGQGSVTGNGQGSVFTITVMWDDTRSGATGTDCSGDSAVDLTCFTLSSMI
ncbi:MAG: type IV pilus modification protein PilV [Gammaproteobacteria bacterium]|nr:type IV pilus modification protein PilV [Gammaproteobacteria bacterium]